MKAVIKYELIINKAMRSALSYDTTDEQINEFIRFFGKHIGSDRIYIFEDNLELKGVEDTPKLIDALEREGIKPRVIEKFGYKNFEDFLYRFENY